MNTKNQFIGDTYDSAGNLYIEQPGSVQFTYDAENHLISTGGQTYLYDGDGKRVAKATNGTPPVPTKLYWYDQAGNSIYETDASGNELYRYFYFAGRLVNREEANDWVDHYGTDALGNTRWLYSQNDGEDFIAYYPFGGERIVYTTSAGNNTRLFTSKERDPESGNDYFGARHYASSMGRFMQPDPSPMGIAMADPQSWNLYSYVRNRPTRSIDVGGNWATHVHADMVTASLEGYMSAGEILELRARQYAMDADQSNPSTHAMANRGQHAEAALTDMWQYVSDQLAVSVQNVNSDGTLNTLGLEALGNALHTVEDFTSPVHTDANFMPLEWNGGFWPPTKMIPGAFHYLGEAGPSNDWSRAGLAIRLSMAAYLQSGAKCEKGKTCLTQSNFESEVQKNIEKYVDSYLDFVSRGTASEGEKDAARQCALGNPAACSIGD